MADDEHEDQDDRGGPAERTGGSIAAAPERRGGGSAFEVYKPGQAPYLRWGSAAGAGIIAISGAMFLYDKMPLLPFGVGENPYVKFLLPVALMMFGAWLVFRMVGQKRKVVDFLIATEGEMKKVHWSTRKEVIGATKVVIFTVLALAIILFLVDALFIFGFASIDILRVDIWRALGFGSPQ